MNAERDPVERTYIMLLLVAPSDEQEVPFAEIKKWSAGERELAEKYAAAVHFKASDNEGVSIPLMPDCLKPFFKSNEPKIR